MCRKRQSQATLVMWLLSLSPEPMITGLLGLGSILVRFRRYAARSHPQIVWYRCFVTALHVSFRHTRYVYPLVSGTDARGLNVPAMYWLFLLVLRCEEKLIQPEAKGTFKVDQGRFCVAPHLPFPNAASLVSSTQTQGGCFVFRKAQKYASSVPKEMWNSIQCVKNVKSSFVRHMPTLSQAPANVHEHQSTHPHTPTPSHTTYRYRFRICNMCSTGS